MPKPRILATACILIAFAGVSLPNAASAYSESFAWAQAGVFCVTSDPSWYESDSQTTGADAFAVATASGTIDPATCQGYGAYSGGGSGIAIASLRRGEMSVGATATGGGPPTSQLSFGTGATTLRDEVTVLGPFAPFSFLAQVGLHVDGTFSGNSTVHAHLQIGSLVNDTCVSTWETYCTIVSPGPFSFDLIANVPVSTGSPTFLLYAGLSAGSQNDGFADASHTGALSITLLPGFTFTSDSGVLLTPEPSLGALMGGAAMSLAAARVIWRKRAGTQNA